MALAFCAPREREHRDVVTVVGHAAGISAGAWITAAGDGVNDRTHCQQFKVASLGALCLLLIRATAVQDPSVSRCLESA